MSAATAERRSFGTRPAPRQMEGDADRDRARRLPSSRAVAEAFCRPLGDR